MESFDLVIIGSGPGGYVAAIRAAQLQLKVACVEKSSTLGGTCLNVGCIPSKALLHSSEYYDKINKHGKEHGIICESLAIDLAQMMSRKNKVVDTLVKGVDGLFKKNHVTRFFGKASLVEPHVVEIQGENVTRIEAKNVLIATGSEPISLPFLPIDEKRILSSTGALSLKEIPKKMLVVGAGVIGLELGSVFSRLGSEVTFVELLDRVCPVFDRGISKALLSIFQKQGLHFHLSTKVSAGTATESAVTLTIQDANSQSHSLAADVVLVAIGRRPYTDGLGLDKLGIIQDSKGFILIDKEFRTNIPHIFAIGDVVEGPMLAHKASEEAVAAVELIAGYPAHINYMAIPNVMYTWPEVACVGLTEEEAKNAGLEVKTGQYPFRANPRARCSGDEEGFVKVIAEARTERIIGVHMIGPNVSEVVGEAAMAIEKRATALDLAQLCHAHPTYSEALKEASLGVYQRILHL